MAEERKHGEGRGNGEHVEVSRRDPEPASWTEGPVSMIRRLAEEMDRAFDTFGLPASGWRRGPLSKELWSPQVEMLERDGNIVVRADLPGLKKEDVYVEVREKALILEGERKQEEEEEREDYYRSERRYGRFYRSIPLPEGIDPDKANATFKDGVLEVRMPAPERAEQTGRRIEIQ